MNCVPQLAKGGCDGVWFTCACGKNRYCLQIKYLDLCKNLWSFIVFVRRVWRYEWGNQNPYIEKEQTTQWPKEKAPKDKQRSTKHGYKTKDQVTRTSLKTGNELRYSGMVSNSRSTSDTRRFNLATNPVISHEWGKDMEVFSTSGTYPWSFVTQIFHSGQPSHVFLLFWGSPN
jgi:hypothetical protein